MKLDEYDNATLRRMVENLDAISQNQRAALREHEAARVAAEQSAAYWRRSWEAVIERIGDIVHGEAPLDLDSLRALLELPDEDSEIALYESSGTGSP